MALGRLLLLFFWRLVRALAFLSSLLLAAALFLLHGAPQLGFLFPLARFNVRFGLFCNPWIFAIPFFGGKDTMCPAPAIFFTACSNWFASFGHLEA